MALFYSNENPQLKEEFAHLQPTQGYCIFIDMVESVALKDKGREHWCAAINNVIYANLICAPNDSVKLGQYYNVLKILLTAFKFNINLSASVDLTNS